MNPTQDPTNTRVIGAPQDHNISNVDDPRYVHPLRVTDVLIEGQPAMQSLWRPEPSEREAIAKGHDVVLVVWGTVHPVVSLAVRSQPLP